MFVTTRRLLLRPGWPEDAPALARTIGDRDVARTLARVPWPYVEADAAAWLARPADAGRPVFLAVLRGTGELVGGIGLHGDGVPEIGYWIARAWWGRGLATEAGRAVLALADHGLRLASISACHALDNPASAGVLAKLGFTATGETGELFCLAQGKAVPVRHLLRRRPGSPDRPAVRLDGGMR